MERSRRSSNAVEERFRNDESTTSSQCKEGRIGQHSHSAHGRASHPCHTCPQPQQQGATLPTSSETTHGSQIFSLASTLSASTPAVTPHHIHNHAHHTHSLPGHAHVHHPTTVHHHHHHPRGHHHHTHSHSHSHPHPHTHTHSHHHSRNHNHHDHHAHLHHSHLQLPAPLSTLLPLSTLPTTGDSSSPQSSSKTSPSAKKRNLKQRDAEGTDDFSANRDDRNLVTCRDGMASIRGDEATGKKNRSEVEA